MNFIDDGKRSLWPKSKTIIDEILIGVFECPRLYQKPYYCRQETKTYP